MLSNNVVYQMRVAKAARALAGVPALAGVGCGCASSTSGVAGYRVVRKLGSYKVVRAVRAGLSGPTDPVVALIPESDKTALINAAKYFIAAKSQTGLHGLRGLADAAQAQGAASMAAAGAKIGSIVPGIGTVIGAVVGAVAGWIMGRKKKDPAPTADQRAACEELLREYEANARGFGDAPLPLDLSTISNLRLCAFMQRAGDVDIHSLNRMNTGFPELVSYCRRLVRKVYETPVGQEVIMPETKLPGAGNIGRKPIPEFRFINTPFISIWDLSNRTIIPAEIERCKDWSKKKSNCAPFFERWIMRRAMLEVMAYAAREELPNISEADLKAASSIATTTGNSAKDVVSVVESLIKRNVQRDETAALLTPQQTDNGPAPPIIPPSVITPLLPTPTPPASTPSDGTTPSDLNVSPPSWMPPGSTSDSLPYQPTSPTTPATQEPVTAGAGSGMPVWMIAAMIFGAAVVLPKKPKRSARK